MARTKRSKSDKRQSAKQRDRQRAAIMSYLVGSGSEDAWTVARDVVSRGLSVRETEALVKHEIDAASTTKGKAEKPQKVKDVHTRAAEEQLRLALGAPVEIRRKGKGGVVTITFGNENELQRIYEYLTDRKA